MLNARKREASDPLLPTRQPKHPRVEESGGLTPHSGLTARWSQLAREVVELASETIKAWGSRSSPSTSLPNHPPRLRRSPPPRPRPRPRPIHTTPSSHLPLPLRPPIPTEFHPDEHQIRTKQTTLSSSLQSDQYFMPTLANPTYGSGSSLQSTSTTGFASVSHSTALPRHQTVDDLLADSMQQCRRAEEINNVLNQRKSKEHIYARKVCFAMSAG
ncbi:hypothetical protein J3R83DRAFT_6887 [Lanmaoa asiatica]|nr:hypothetical protein J3R83DRAFT_6887 [Lanmaoa asiatica]